MSSGRGIPTHKCSCRALGVLAGDTADLLVPAIYAGQTAPIRLTLVGGHARSLGALASRLGSGASICGGGPRVGADGGGGRLTRRRGGSSLSCRQLRRSDSHRSTDACAPRKGTGAGHRDVDSELNNLALLYQAQGRYMEAELSSSLTRKAWEGGQRSALTIAMASKYCAALGRLSAAPCTRLDRRARTMHLR